MTESRIIDIADVRAAGERLRGHVHRTPVITSTLMDAEYGATFVYKAEHVQRTGSFKVRGALNALLGRTAPPVGVVAFSAGNHAAAVALAARSTGIPAVVCMPAGAYAHKIRAVQAYGGEVVLCEGDLAADARRIADERGYALLHPFDAPLTMAGQGTVALELFEDRPDLDVVVVPVGGGGLIGGVATVVQALSPKTRVIAAEPRAAALVRRSLADGVPARHAAAPQTMADGLAAPFLGASCLAQIAHTVDTVIEVEEADMVEASARILHATKQLIEPAAAAAVAAAMRYAATAPGATVGVILSGGNASPEAIAMSAAALPTITWNGRAR